MPPSFYLGVGWEGVCAYVWRGWGLAVRRSPFLGSYVKAGRAG